MNRAARRPPQRTMGARGAFGFAMGGVATVVAAILGVLLLAVLFVGSWALFLWLIVSLLRAMGVDI
jgi:hypothetical protein